jgi:FAD/FMN-containing dehydrogenase
MPILTGYGPFVGNYGLGVDQILGAKVVNCEGKLVEGDERMLQAIRGGGGTLGVIVEMTIKVYPLDKVQRLRLGVFDPAEA